MTIHDAITTIPQRMKLTVRDFMLLADAGAFADYVRTELIEGEIWVVNSVHRRHARVHAMMTVAVGAAVKALDAPLILYTAPSTELSDTSLPEPDIALAELSEGKLLSGAALRLAVEISDATLSVDLGRKARLYARHGVPEYWVVDVEAEIVHQMWAPSPEDYRQRRTVALGKAVAAETIAGLVVETLVV